MYKNEQERARARAWDPSSATSEQTWPAPRGGGPHPLLPTQVVGGRQPPSQNLVEALKPGADHMKQRILCPDKGQEMHDRLECAHELVLPALHGNNKPA